MRRNKLITLGLLLVSSLAITMPLITSCSTTLEETVVPPVVVPPVVDEYKDCMFKGLNGKIYSFHKVSQSILGANNEPQLRFAIKTPMPDGGIVTYYEDVAVSKETYNYYNNV